MSDSLSRGIELEAEKALKRKPTEEKKLFQLSILISASDRFCQRGECRFHEGNHGGKCRLIDRPLTFDKNNEVKDLKRYFRHPECVEWTGGEARDQQQAIADFWASKKR